MVEIAGLRLGLKGSAALEVGEEHTAPKVGSGRVHVLATPVMINLMEAAALDAMEKFLPEGRQSLGTHLDVSHVAATPVGMRVTAKAEVTAVDGNKVALRVEAMDEAGLDEGPAEGDRGREARAEDEHLSRVGKAELRRNVEIPRIDRYMRHEDDEHGRAPEEIEPRVALFCWRLHRPAPPQHTGLHIGDGRSIASQFAVAGS